MEHFNRCQWCNRTLSPATATVDHILPICSGGTDADNNLCLCCQACNNKKDNQDHGRPPYGPPDWSLVLGELKEGEGNLYADMKAIWDRPGPSRGPDNPAALHLLLRDGRPIYQGTRDNCEKQERHLQEYLDQSGRKAILEIRPEKPPDQGPPTSRSVS